MSLNSKRRWSGLYYKKDEPSQASIKSIASEKELSGAGSDSLKKNAKKIQKQKTQKTFMKKTADSVKNWKKQKKKFVS